MDVKPRGDGGGSCRRIRRVESKGLGIACSGGTTSREERGKSGFFTQQRESKKEEEEVREEAQEGEDQGTRNQAYQGFVRENRAGPRAHSEEEDVKECQEGGSQEKQEVKLVKQFIFKLRGVESRGGRALRDLRARGKGASGVEPSSWVSDAGDVRPHAEGIGTTDGAAVGFGSGVTPPGVHSVLEDSTRSPGVKAYVAGDADLGSTGGDFRVSQRQELVPAEVASMSSPVETLEASKLQREEAKVKAAAGKGWDRRFGKGESDSWDAKGKGKKGEYIKGKGKGSKGDGRKGDGKKPEEEKEKKWRGG